MLLLTLVLCCIVGLVTPYLLVAIGLGVTVTLLARGTLLQLSDGLAARLFAAVFVVLAICFALSARSPHDLIYALNFVMLLLFAPLRGLLQSGCRPRRRYRVARMALAGTVVALCVVGFDLLVLGDPRGQSPLLGAILLANTAVLLGFLSLLGTIAPQSRYRWVYLAGPIVGIITALLTGSRGPLLAVLPLALVSLLFDLGALPAFPTGVSPSSPSLRCSPSLCWPWSFRVAASPFSASSPTSSPGTRSRTRLPTSAWRFTGPDGRRSFIRHCSGMAGPT